MYLNEIKEGEMVRIIAVKASGKLHRRLLEMGLTPRTKVKLIKTAPLGDPIEIQLRDYQLTIRKEDAKNIEVEKIR